jgi:hypothetical protein
MPSPASLLESGRIPIEDGRVNPEDIMIFKISRESPEE